MATFCVVRWWFGRKNNSEKSRILFRW